MARTALKRKKPQVVYQAIEGPTRERLRAAGEFYEVGDDKAGHKKWTMQDSPLARLKARRAIDPKEYAALMKYAHHWYHAGLSPGVGSVDLNRVFSSDPSNSSGMAKSEGQAHHRSQWRKAREVLGHRPGIIVDNVVCCEWPLAVAGHSIGYDSPYRARQAAAEILRDAGYRLAKMWGIG